MPGGRARRRPLGAHARARQDPGEFAREGRTAGAHRQRGRRSGRALHVRLAGEPLPRHTWQITSVDTRKGGQSMPCLSRPLAAEARLPSSEITSAVDTRCVVDTVTCVLCYC